MEKTFNELFDDFFKKNNINPEDKISVPKEDAQRLIDILTNIKPSEAMDLEMEAEFDKTLGKPDKIEFYTENGFFFERRIWHTPQGDMFKLFVSDDPTLVMAPPEPKSLESQLNEAVEDEDYEKAAIIRDRIQNKK